MLGGQSGKINYPIRNFVGYIGILGGKLRMHSEGGTVQTQQEGKYDSDHRRLTAVESPLG